MFFVGRLYTYGLGNILSQPLYQIIQVNQLELTNTEIGYARVCYFTCLLVSYFVVGGIIDRFSAKHTVAFWACCLSRLYRFYMRSLAIIRQF